MIVPLCLPPSIPSPVEAMRDAMPRLLYPAVPKKSFTAIQ